MNKSIFKSVLATTMVSFFGAAALTSVVNAQSITGAGATFPAPIYAKWAAEYNKATGIKVNYQSVGSGAGIKQIDSKTVDFGASDMPQTDDVLKAKGQFQFPTVIGGTVPVINIKGIAPGQMKLDGQVLGDIYLGKITKWNDAAIKALNPTLALPDADIAPVRRADGSGTTFNFTNYLSRVHPEWKAKVGEGTAVNWPVGAGGKGNEGVAAFVNRLPNSIGYVEYSYVIQNKMNYTLMKNKDGVFVSPSEEAFKAAAAGADWNKTFYQLITDQPGKGTWPISTATFILMHVQQDKPAQATETFKFFTWAFKNGDALASSLDYVPLPDSVVSTIEKAWGTVKDTAGKPVALK
ncbi:MAG: phosphate ABC transporter substrate-binding protein PstS [Rhodoferax sp.]|uniref:phosphate ABC transporter substrate-binding protein PstS n=1 Tax=Rhodoferax sp. TaxID=50421 RepID=UPI002718D8D0|nr:phosphate ABC transporter substrate-binding protein PstS [Rhodoferax sp.]MDO9145384.1 phosphate ABC transporter substrate-binding protein PstS [Rhodoferax sp.]MDP1527811.1 phosphate ABC transporter substrate-binding protein PstS [Rhodoferax sp.]MDP1942511.1 phosphate ABC transporter substrate-binding protein PstS [Rhodoferax sp.]MDP3193298.1 phosphate ABC transporter substrate-binding protein PstS [Rhodoferax sp.]MDP3336059.1 phosphate ABC transporter substrate-binding protein PstS [Rhodofe